MHCREPCEINGRFEIQRHLFGGINYTNYLTSVEREDVAGAQAASPEAGHPAGGQMWHTCDGSSTSTTEVALPSLSRDFPCQMQKNQTQMHHEHTGASESRVHAGDVAEAALQVCLNKVKFNCGHLARV